MEKLITFILALLIVIGLDLVLTYPLMLLWNWLMPMIFGLTKLTFWQTFGLSVFVAMLFYQPRFNNTNN